MCDAFVVVIVVVVLSFAFDGVDAFVVVVCGLLLMCLMSMLLLFVCCF